MAAHTVEDEGDVLPQTLDEFLASVEQRAYRIAMVALSEHDEALDVVQDTMIRLVNKYSERPPAEWRTLFFTILHNRITDSHRKNTLRQRRHFGLHAFNTLQKMAVAITERTGDAMLLIKVFRMAFYFIKY